MIFECISVFGSRGRSPSIRHIRRVDAARPSRSGVFLFPPLWAATFILLAAPVTALAGDGQPAMLDNWLANLAYVMGLLYMAGRLWQLNRPNPPNHRQFAQLDHQHADALSRGDLDASREQQTREIMTIRQEMGGFTAKVERQIDHLRDAVTTQNAQMMSALEKYTEHNEDRVRRVHARLDPLPSAIAANTRSIETHLADHRAGKA
jgi:gas vesicle protein